MRECFLNMCRGDGEAAQVHNVPSEPSREEASTIHTCFFSADESESCAPSRQSQRDSHSSDRTRRSARRRKGGIPIETRPSPIIVRAKLSRSKEAPTGRTQDGTDPVQDTQTDCIKFTRCSSTRKHKPSKSEPKKGSPLFRRTSFLFHAKTACSQEIKRSLSNKKPQIPKSKSGHSRSQSVVPQFTLDQIDAATRGFASALHASNSCDYFKGELEGGFRVVVKDFAEDRLRKSHFLEEACILGRIRHPNLACVRGVCLEGERRMLVYEDVGVATLSGILHTPYEFRHLGIATDWVSRLKIALDVAKGLNHLHCGCNTPFVHGNITSSSIMMKESGRPLLSDFSIGHTHPSDRIDSSEQFRLTPTPNGYEAPELRGASKKTPMSDVFAFGVLFLEIMCGCPPFTFNIQEGLVTGVKTAVSKGALAEVIDPTLRSKFSLRQVARCIQLALSCTEEYPADRPTISAIVDDLKGVIALDDDGSEDSDAWGCLANEDDR